MRGSAVLGAAVVFSVAMGALSSGGWWWAWLAAIALFTFGGRVRVPLGGVQLTRYVMRQNQITRRNNRRTARQIRRRTRTQRRAARTRRRQAQ
jgi:hypothetical protein